VSPKLPLQVLAVDLDGTLISNYQDFDQPVSAENLAALRELREAGTRVLICTGRNEVSARSVLARAGDAELAASDLILQNGALVIEGGSGRLLASRHLPRAEAARVLAVYREYSLEPLLFDSHERGAALLYEREPANPRFALYLSIRAREDGDPDSLRRVDDLATHLDVDPLALATIDYRERIDPAREAMEVLALPTARVALQGLIAWAGGPPAFFLEAFHRDVAKENAFADYCCLRGYDPARCGAIGDGHNDLELIRRVGLGVAMANAPESVRSAADHVAPPYNESGLAAAVRAHFLP